LQDHHVQDRRSQLSLELGYMGSEPSPSASKYPSNPFELVTPPLDLSSSPPNLGDILSASKEDIEQSPKGKRTSPEDELAYMLSEDFLDPLADYDGPKVQLFNKQDVLATIETTAAGDLESQSRNFRIVKKLIANGQFRKLRQLDESFLYDLRALQDRFEQFSEVVQYIARAAMLAKRRGDNVLQMTPILLIGEPGTGKTEFATELAKILRTAFKKIDMASAQNNFELAGSSSFYANSTPGKVLLLCMQKYEGEFSGNPLLLLDELDKGCGNHDIPGADPSGPLLALLERHTATRFVDLCIDIPVDVSHFHFIATCNSPALISSPIRSRFSEFYISLTDVQKKQIAIRITHELSDELNTRDIVFHPSAIESLAALDSPRLVKQAVADAIGGALLGNRDVITAADMRTSKPSGRKIGFV
jgi:ATP-dependent Lon protease